MNCDGRNTISVESPYTACPHKRTVRTMMIDASSIAKRKHCAHFFFGDNKRMYHRLRGCALVAFAAGTLTLIAGNSGCSFANMLSAIMFWTSAQCNEYMDYRVAYRTIAER